MDSKVPGWMIAAIVVQTVLAGLFFLYGYSETKTLALGRAPAMRDVVAMALPLAAVGVFGAAAWIQWRSGRRSMAKTLVWAPIPLSVLLFGLLGII
jgi:hypothetical protein